MVDKDKEVNKEMVDKEVNKDQVVKVETHLDQIKEEIQHKEIHQLHLEEF